VYDVINGDDFMYKSNILIVILTGKLNRKDNNKNISEEINDFSKFDFTKLNYLKKNEDIEENIEVDTVL